MNTDRNLARRAEIRRPVCALRAARPPIYEGLAWIGQAIADPSAAVPELTDRPVTSSRQRYWAGFGPMRDIRARGFASVRNQIRGSQFEPTLSSLKGEPSHARSLIQPDFMAWGRWHRSGASKGADPRT